MSIKVSNSNAGLQRWEPQDLARICAGFVAANKWEGQVEARPGLWIREL